MAEDLANRGHTVFVCSESPIEETVSQKITLINIDPFESQEAGYHSSLPELSRLVSAYDIAIYYFSRKRGYFNHVWLIDDDVFIANLDTLKNLDARHTHTDLLTSTYNHNGDGDYNKNGWYHWRQTIGYTGPPWVMNSAAAVRVSKRLFTFIDMLVKTRYRLLMRELMFGTACHKAKFSQRSPPELSTLSSKKKLTTEDFKLAPTNLFHPVRDIENYDSYFQEINQLAQSEQAAQPQ